MAKQRGCPDRRGFGAQSDFIAERFVPSEDYKAQQVAMSKELIAQGVNPEQLADMFMVHTDLLYAEKAKDQ